MATSSNPHAKLASASQLELNLQSAAHKVMNSSKDVKGLVCCNENGELYSSTGTMNDESAAIISHLTMLVYQLENENPVIQLTGKHSKVLIHKRANVIVGIHKSVSR